MTVRLLTPQKPGHPPVTRYASEDPSEVDTLEVDDESWARLMELLADPPPPVPWLLEAIRARRGAST